MPTVGEILSDERRRQGKSLADAVVGTKIRSRLLDALDNRRYDAMPSTAYVQGQFQSLAACRPVSCPPDHARLSSYPATHHTPPPPP